MSENADGDADPYHSQKLNRVDDNGHSCAFLGRRGYAFLCSVRWFPVTEKYSRICGNYHKKKRKVFEVYGK